MILKHHYDIGVAVSTEGGLVVPVVRDADRLSCAEIEREIGRAGRTRIVDGAEAVQFLAMVKELVEDSESLLIQG